jgi:hypothetical protein
VATDRLAPIIRDGVNKLMSVAGVSGYFDRVQSYEPKSNPGPGLTFATWINQILPVALESGLAVTSARLVMTCRIYLPMLTDPQDDIDTTIAVAASHMMAQLTGDFALDPAWIDLLGAHGEGLGVDLGYINDLDESSFRIGDILVPFICPDVFDQEA